MSSNRIRSLSARTVNTLGVGTDTITYFDGLGRKSETRTADPGCSSDIEVDTTYDSMSRVYTVSNPYCTTSDPTYGLTTYLYDGLGRKTQVTLADGAVTTFGYAATATQIYEPSNNDAHVQHIQQTNGIGQLTNVCEVTSEPYAGVSPSSCGLYYGGNGFLTSYAYDPLNDLTSVSQHGVSRSFNYDAMSRLILATNPEAGATNYYYTTSGSSLCAGDPAAPCRKTDARSVTTSYSYDSLNRLLTKTYSGGGSSTPIGCFQYDNSSISCVPSTPNLMGHVTNAWTQAASTSCASAPNTFITLKSYCAFDAVGRPLNIQQQSCVAGNCTTSTAPQSYLVGASYDLIGNMTTLTNPVGANKQPLTLTNFFDSVSRPCLTTSSWTSEASPNLFEVSPGTTNPGYSPGGGLKSFYLGSTSSSTASGCSSSPASPINEVLGYTKRFFVNSISTTGQLP